MGAPFTIEIPYDQLLLLVMALFMFVGATRGAYREAITSIGLVVLLAVLVKPGLVAPIVGYLSSMVRLIIAFLRSHFSVNPEVLLSTYKNVAMPFDGENPYPFLMVALVGFVLLSYASRGGKDITAFSRILGGLLGLFNGFMVVSLFKEYVVKYVEGRTGAVAVMGPGSGVSVALRDLPSSRLVSPDNWQFTLALLAIVGALVVISMVGLPPKKRG